MKGVPPAKVMFPWSRGTGIAKIAGATPLMTVQLTAIKGAVPFKWCPQLKWCLRGDITIAGATSLARGFILINKPPCQGWVLAIINRSKCVLCWFLKGG